MLEREIPPPLIVQTSACCLKAVKQPECDKSFISLQVFDYGGRHQPNNGHDDSEVADVRWGDTSEPRVLLGPRPNQSIQS